MRIRTFVEPVTCLIAQFLAGYGRAAEFGIDPLIVEFSMQIVLSCRFIRLIPHSDLCLVLPLTYSPSLFIEPGMIHWFDGDGRSGDMKVGHECGRG